MLLILENYARFVHVAKPEIFIELKHCPSYNIFQVVFMIKKVPHPTVADPGENLTGALHSNFGRDGRG